MAIYEYRCSACGYSFELVRPMGQADAPARCPSCGGGSQRLVSQFAHSEGSRLRVPSGEVTLILAERNVPGQL